ncbi:MAG: TetR/AcrR family transcriptional regulator [Chloroflexota bacterium]
MSTQTLDPRVRRTRKLLKQAFVELMHEKGFNAMTVQDIADRADINRTTFYDHYEDKFALHDQMILEWFQQKLADYTITQDATFCGDNLRKLIYAVCDFVVQMNGGCHGADLQYKPAIEDLMQATIQDIVHSWMTSLDGIEHADIHAASISYAIFGAGMQWSKDQTHSKGTVADTLISLIRDGLKAQVTNLPELVTQSA